MARTKSLTSKTKKETTPANNAAAVPATPVAAANNVRTITSGLATRNPGVTKAETRGKGSATGLDEEIRRRAYELYRQRGYSSGTETDDWLVAEREVLQRHHQHSA